jgi:hypothetical protein
VLGYVCVVCWGICVLGVGVFVCWVLGYLCVGCWGIYVLGVGVFMVRFRGCRRGVKFVIK